MTRAANRCAQEGARCAQEGSARCARGRSMRCARCAWWAALFERVFVSDVAARSSAARGHASVWRRWSLLCERHGMKFCSRTLRSVGVSCRSWPRWPRVCTARCRRCDLCACATRSQPLLGSASVGHRWWASRRVRVTLGADSRRSRDSGRAGDALSVASLCVRYAVVSRPWSGRRWRED